MIAALNLLIIDDDTPTVQSLHYLLNRLGAEKITTARSGMEGYELIAKSEQRFDCVISDVCMPEGNGLELLYRIRTSTAGRNFRPDMCVVLMSGLASPQIAGTARDLDVNGFLVKPFTVNKLEMTVASARRRAFRLNQRRYCEINRHDLRVAA